MHVNRNILAVECFSALQLTVCKKSLAQDLEFHGVMRFYFQDRVAGNFATKCIRVSSTATTQDVIETLAEKFRPDMRMLSSPKYSLYEVHVSGGECHKPGETGFPVSMLVILIPRHGGLWDEPLCLCF